MQKNKNILYKWMILAVFFSGFLFDAPPPVVAASATAPYTFQPLAISALSPANNQVIPPNHPLQIQLNTSDPNWPRLRVMFEEGLYGLRLLNSSNNKVKWYFPLPKLLPNLPSNVSNTISYNSTTHLVTVLASDLGLGQTYAPMLAVGAGLAALVAGDLGKTYPIASPLCCTWPAQGTSTWTFQVSNQAPSSVNIATSSGGTASTLPLPIQNSNTTVQANITGVGSVTLAVFGSADPADKPGNFKPYGGYFDVYIGLGSSLSKIVLKECNSAGTNLYFFNGNNYFPVTPAPVLAGGCLTTTLTGTSSPMLVQLSGTFFTAGIPAPTLDALSSSQGPTGGGDTLKLTGTNFTDQNGNSLVQAVTFGPDPVPASKYTVLSSSAIEVWDTPGGSGPVNIQVTTSGGSSAASPASLYTYSTASSTQAIGVPAYFYPGPLTDWDKLNNASPSVKLAIINPANGPGATCNPTYAAQVNASHASGITVIGYIYTRYANTTADFNGSYDRTIAAVKSEIDLYYSCYPNLDGIFFDEAGSSCTDAAQYYAPLSAYLKNKAGRGLAVLNAGNASNECFMTAADTLVTFEGEYGTYISPTYTQPAWVANYSPDRFWHLVYNVPDYSSLRSTLNLSKQRGAGWVYATPLDCAGNAAPPCTAANPLNPWSALPPAGYWNDELQLIQPSLPVINSLSQNGGPAAGGTSLSITGQNFGGATTVCFGSVCVFPATSSHPSGFNLNSARNQITLNTPPGIGGKSIDVEVTTPVGTSLTTSSDLFSYAPVPVSSGNLISNGNFGSGLTGWVTNCKGFSGSGYAEGANCSFAASTSTGGLTLTSTGNPPYEGVYQIVPATANSILNGTVTVNSMNECGDGSVSVSVTLLDANQNPLGPTLNSDPMFGNIVLSHHPYINCAPYLFPNTSSSYFQDMPGWRAGNGPQNFSLDLNSIIAQNLPGITASQVANLKIQLTDYADTTQPSVTFSNLSLNGNTLPAFQTLNVRDFGAAGDGVADDTAAFINALGQLKKAGGILVVPAGTYSVQPNTLVVQSNITILGSGATLKARSAGYILLEVAGSDIYISGLTLDANTQVSGIVNIDPNSMRVVMTGDTLQHARQPNDTSNPYFHNNVIGIQVYGNSSDILLDALTIKDIWADNPELCSGGNCTRVARGIRISHGDAATMTAKNLTIQNSLIQEVGPKEDGDCLVIQDSTDEANLSVFQNTFDRCHKRAIKIQVPGAVVGYNTINNSFQPGENFTAPGTPYAQSAFAYDMYAAISVYQGNVQVIGNTISGIGSFYNAVEVGACGTLSGVSVQNNYVHMGLTSSTVNGAALIRMLVPVNNLYIYGNTLDYALYGIVNPAGVSNSGIYTNNNIFVNLASYDYLVNFGTPC